MPDPSPSPTPFPVPKTIGDWKKLAQSLGIKNVTDVQLKDPGFQKNVLELQRLTALTPDTSKLTVPPHDRLVTITGGTASGEQIVLPESQFNKLQDEVQPQQNPFFSGPLSAAFPEAKKLGLYLKVPTDVESTVFEKHPGDFLQKQLESGKGGWLPEDIQHPEKYGYQHGGEVDGSKVSDAQLEAAVRLASQPQPEAQPQQGAQTQAQDRQDALLEAGVNQYLEESKSPAERALELSPANILGSLGTRALVSQVGGAPGSAALTAAGFESGMLQGLSVDSIKMLKPRLEAQAKEESDAIDRMVNRGTQGTDPNFYAATQRLNNLQDRIKEADNIISTGKTSQPARVVGGALEQFGKAYDTGAMERKLEAFYPKNEFEKTPIGQIAQGGANALTMGGVAAAFGPFAGTAYATSQMSDGVYQAKKEGGSSDEDAERAAALTSLVTLPTMLAAGPSVDFLAKSFAGFSAKQGMQAIIKAGVPAAIRTFGAGAEFGVIDWEQKVVGQLQGYDPNRPLDQSFWNNFWMGSAFGLVHGVFAKDPQMARLNKPDVTVRSKEPAEQVAQPTVTPAAAPVVTPTTTGAKPTVVTPVPKESPEDALNNLASSVTGEKIAGEGFQILPGGQPPQYTGPARPVREAAPTLQLAAPQAQVTVPSTEHIEAQGETTPVAQLPRTHEEIEQEVQKLQMQQARALRTPEVMERQRELEAKAEPFSLLKETPNRDAAAVHAYGQGLAEARAERPDLPIPDLHFRAGEIANEIREQAGRKEEVFEEPAAEAAETKAPADFTQAQNLYIDDNAKRFSSIKGNERGFFKRVERELKGAGSSDEDVNRLQNEIKSRGLALRRAATPAPETPYWETEEPAASRIQNLGAEPVDRPVGPADVKAEVNAFQAKSGTHNNVVYVPNVEALPDHVKNGLTPQERANGAQIVTDNKLGNTYVIGDRFDSLLDLRRKLIEEVIPYRYRNVAKLEVTHDPSNPDTGNYDPISDRATLNLHAILRSADPYSEAAKTAMEEINVHQGISRLLGNRYGINYVNAMKQVQAQFDRMGWTDLLAQKKGYKNADEMAAAYKVPDWRKGGWQANKMTEELIGAYSRNFTSPEELAANGPAWYQTALRRISNGIRSFLGLEVSPYDVQSLLHDSAAALREAKANEPTLYHPSIGEAAKQDMANFRMANRPPQEGGEGGPGGEFVDITGEFAKARIAEARAGLQPGEQLRTQPMRFAFQQKRTTQERLNFLRDWPLKMNHEGWVELMQTVRDLYQQDLGNDPAKAIDFIANNRLEGARNPAIAEVVGREATKEINALRASGDDEQANILAAKLDRMNQIRAADATSAARETAAQALLHKDGSTNVAHHKNTVTDVQNAAVDKLNRKTPGVKDAINNGLDQVKDVTKEAAEKVRQKSKTALDKIQNQFVGPRVPPGYYDRPEGAGRQGLGESTDTLTDQYTDDLVNRIEDAMYKTNAGFTPRDKPVLQNIFDQFRSNIQQIVREQMPKEEKPKVPRPSETDKLKTVMENYPYYKEAWARTMDMLEEHNPELVQRFHRALEEPLGETSANKLATEHGVDLSDLIYNHLSTTDRLTSDLASKISSEFNIPSDLAKTITQHLQNMFGDIVRDEQADKLASILKNVGGTRSPPKGELDRLVDHIVIGGLDNAEWLNHVAPRFGIEHLTPEKIEQMRQAGDYLSYLRDMGMQNSAIAQKAREQLGDLMKLSRNGLERSKFIDQVRFAADVYSAGLLTGLMTHGPYWLQVMMSTMVNRMALTFRMMHEMGQEGRDIPVPAMQMLFGSYASWWDGMKRGAAEFKPTVREGIKPPEEFMPQHGDQPLYRGTLDKPAPFEGTPIQPVAELYRNYRYVRNALDAISNLLVRGGQYATHHSMAMKLAWENGLSGEDAWEAARATVLGTPEQQARAVTEAQNIVDDLNAHFPDRPVSKYYQKILEGELLDRYKTTSENKDNSLADLESQKLRDYAERAYAPALRGSLRGDVAGAWGYASRGMLNATSRYPALKFFMPFLKVPFNLANDLLSYGPLGIWRSRNIEGYLGGIPGMEGKIKRGEISPEQLQDMAGEQLIKGVLGSAATGILYGLFRTWLNDPNAPVRLTFNGPTDYGQQEIERGKGWQQKSFYLDPKMFGNFGGWHSYENTPLRAVLAGIGAMSDYIRYEKKPGEPWTANDEMYLHTKMLQSSLSSIFGSPLQGPETALHLLTAVGSPKELQRNIGDFISQMTTAAVTTPIGGTFFRQLWRLHDPTQYQAETPWGKMFRYVPVLNGLLGEPKLNVFGEHMKSDPMHSFPEYSPTGGMLGTGIGREVDPNDPVWHYLESHPGLHLDMPGNTASVARIKMDPAEIYQFHLARGPVLKEFLREAFKDPRFAEMPVARQNLLIKNVYERAANRAGQIAVLNYRKDHPVEPERIRRALTARGVVESAETEAAMDRLPSPLAPVPAQ